MKLFGRNIISSIIWAALAAVQMVSFTSCDSVIYDDLDPCDEGLRLRFVYDYNMEFANAFPSQVDCLTLLVYDKDGNYLETRTETAPQNLSDENWRMTIDLPAGTYRLLAYGGLQCSEASFAFTSQPSAALPMEGVQVGMLSSCITSPVGTKLHNLFYGALEVTVPEKSSDYTEATVPMMKDTNNIRILLQQLNGKPVNDSDFDFAIVNDNNTLLDWQNIPVSTATPITYYPWTKGQAIAGQEPDGSDAVLAFAEFSTSRLYLANSPRLKVTRRAPGTAEDGETVIDIPLINYLLLLKSQEFSSMGSQEFLDRESRWNMIFFLDENNFWIRTVIVINDWVVRINDTEL